MKHVLRMSRKEHTARMVGLCITTCLICIIMSSCAGKKPTEQFDLEIVTFYDSHAEADAFNALIRQFEKATKLRVYAESIPRETYYTSLEQYMSSDYPPDILAFHPGWYFRNYAAKGLSPQ